MLRIIRSMMYRATHSILFYVAIGFCLCGSILLFGLSGNWMKNNVPSEYDKDVIVHFEDEDALNVNKHLLMGDNDYRNVPGHDILYRDSLVNVSTVDNAIVETGIIILIFSVVYGILFFGDLFNKNAIRNMMSAGAGKLCIYFASVIVNTLFLLIFSAVSAAALAIYCLIFGIYPIIYVPSVAVALLAELLIGILAGMAVILVIFLTQKPIRALLVLAACVVVLAIINNSMDITGAFDSKYDLDGKAFSDFIIHCKDHGSDFEWYIPVNNFNIYSINYADGTLYNDYVMDELNPEYAGDTSVALKQTLWRLGVPNLPFELMVFNSYPLYRDGVLLRYIIVTSGYIILLAGLSAVIIRKRNIN
ncbi:hypothetical protein SAMN02910456_01024 [Ruminococcaceae bacterium YRB3002]|nr:hypothetical protein SAMN02910456_01024 [Ruminococcaceae bacterium YRB3002]